MKLLELVTTVLKYLSKATWPIFPEYAPTLGIYDIWIIKYSWRQVMGTASNVLDSSLMDSEEHAQLRLFFLLENLHFTLLNLWE